MICISVIVPNYNHERFLKERIDSILRQTYSHFEVLLMDDASTDRSKEILESYRHHEKVKGIYYNDKNSGSPFYQWKSGIEKSRYDWIWIAESDDSCDPEFLEKCVEQIEKNPSATMIMTQSNWIDAAGKKFQRKTAFETEGLKKGNEVLKDYLLRENSIKNASAVVFNQKKMEPAEVSTASTYKWCGDWAFWDHLCTKGDLYFIDQPMNHFRRHETAASNELYYQGYLYKEGLRLSLKYQKKLKTDLLTRVKTFYHWCHYLFNQYLDNFKKGRLRLYLFRPLYYCVMMHTFLPLVAIDKLARKIAGNKNRSN